MCQLQREQSLWAFTATGSCGVQYFTALWAHYLIAIFIGFLLDMQGGPSMHRGPQFLLDGLLPTSHCSAMAACVTSSASEKARVILVLHHQLVTVCASQSFILFIFSMEVVSQHNPWYILYSWCTTYEGCCLTQSLHVELLEACLHDPPVHCWYFGTLIINWNCCDLYNLTVKSY